MKNQVKINTHIIILQAIMDQITQDPTQIKVLQKIEETLIILTHTQALILSTLLLISMKTGRKNPTKIKKWTIVKVI